MDISRLSVGIFNWLLQYIFPKKVPMAIKLEGEGG